MSRSEWGAGRRTCKIVVLVLGKDEWPSPVLNTRERERVRYRSVRSSRPSVGGLVSVSMGHPHGTRPTPSAVKRKQARRSRRMSENSVELVSRATGRRQGSQPSSLR